MNAIELDDKYPALLSYSFIILKFRASKKVSFPMGSVIVRGTKKMLRKNVCDLLPLSSRKKISIQA